MPMVRVTSPKGALTDEQKSVLAEELTSVLLMIEGGSDNPFARAIAYVLFTETAAEDWYVGGRLDQGFVSPPGRFIFDVTVPEGSCDQVRKGRVHEAVNRALLKTLGIEDGTAGRSAWVIIHEVREGHWGAAGRTVSIRDISAAAEMLPDRAVYFEQLLAARKRAHEASAYPPAAASY